MYIKLHRSYRTVVALCDKEIIGKKFEEGIRQLDIRENFYKGDEIDEQKAIEILIRQAKEDATFNIAGEKSVQAAIKAGIVDESAVSKIENIPFILILI